MRRFLSLVFALVLFLAPLALSGQEAAAPAQHEGQPAGESRGAAAHEAPAQGGGHGTGEHESGNIDLWKWANFAVLAGLIGYAIKKNAGPFFASRSAEIRKGIADAEMACAAAEKRSAEMDARLAHLHIEIEAMRAETLAEQQAEAARIREATAAEMAKIQVHAQGEIASAGKAARQELRRHASSLALGIAEQKLRARMTPETDEGLVGEFVRNVNQS